MKGTKEFNHINKNLDKEKIEELMKYYSYYDKMAWCCEKLKKKNKRLDLSCNICSTVLIIVGTLVGGITVNPIILGTLNGAGMLLSLYSTKQKFAQKIVNYDAMLREYEKVKSELKNYLRGVDFDSEILRNQLAWIDELLIDRELISQKMKEKFENKR